VSTAGRPILAAILVATAVGCSQPPTEAPPDSAASPSKTSLVRPPGDDSSADILSWVDGEVVTKWGAERAKRDRAIELYLNDNDAERAVKYGFRSGQTPRLAWDWFQNNPIGFEGIPFVLLKTILDLDPNDPNPPLRTIARIWKRQPTVPVPGAASAGTLDHLGVWVHPADYMAGVARPPAERRSPLPFGFAFENPRVFEPLSAAEATTYDAQLQLRRSFSNTSLLLAKLRTADATDNWERDRPGFGSPGSFDRVSFSCAACHVGRVMVSGRMQFLPGMPNTEIEAQYYAKLLMLTSAAVLESGFDPQSHTPVNPANIRPSTAAMRALYTAMLDKARLHPETLYGPAPAQIARAKVQALAVAEEFPSVIRDLIATGVKTHFIFKVVAANQAYTRPLPDVFEDRPGQMDAFGLTTGLIAVHTRRSDNSFLEFVRRDNPNSPIFSGFSKANGLPADMPGMTDSVGDGRTAGERMFKNLPLWGTAVPAAVDIKSVNWGVDRYHANWDGNQGASSGVLVSGALATGDPRMVNLRVYEPLNPFIDNLPPRPYPFESVDLARAKEGKALFKTACATCHTRRNQTIYSATKLGVDANRSLVTSSVSRYGLAALMAETCTIYGLNNQGRPGADWCRPQGDWQARLDEYFRDTPRRVVEGTNGYKADVLHGIWAQAPYLHNGSVPTLGHLVCQATRPRRFLRGNVYYDESLVGFEWADRPGTRYSDSDSILVKEYDTAVPGRANGGHTFGADLCPDTSGLDPVADRKEIASRILQSRAGALLAYLKTL
jgi:hypothetical protein